MDIPADVQDRIRRNWDAVPGDVQGRLLRAGFEPMSVPESPMSPAPPQEKPSTPEARTDYLRRSLQIGGATVGGLAGLSGGGLPALAGAAGGYGLGGTAADLIEGKPEGLVRGGIQGIAAAGAQALLPEAAPVMAAARSGLVSAIAGQVYDLAKSWWTGKRQGVFDQWKTVAGDVAGGATGEALSQTMARGAARREARRAEDLGRIANRRQQFAEAGITPKASELTDSTTVEGLEDIPRGTLTGSARVRRFEEQRTGEAQRAVTSRIAGISPAGVTDEEWSGNVVRRSIDEGRDAAAEAWNQAFRATEAVTGDAPVVPVANTLRALNREATVGRTVPAGAPAYTTRIADELVTAFGLDPEDAAAVEAATADGRIPFHLARRLESQLGRMGFRGRPPVGSTPQQAAASRVYQAVLRDLDQFYDTEVGQGIRPELDAAKQQFRAGIALYNDSKVRNFLRANVDPESAVRLAFKPGNVTATRDLQQAVPDEVFDQAVQGWLQGLYDKHVRMVGDREDFDQMGFARDVQSYEKNGHLDAILGPERAEDLRQVVATFRLMRRPGSVMSRSSGTAERASRYAGIAAPAAMISEIISGISTGHPLAGLAGAAGTGATVYGVPAALARLTTTPTGIDWLTRAFTTQAPMNPTTRSVLGQLGGQGMLR